MRTVSTLLVALFLFQLLSEHLAVGQFIIAEAAIPFSKISHTNKIDTHCHFVPPWYKELLNSRNLTAGGKKIPSWNATEHLALNAMVGVQTSVLSISTPGVKLSMDAPVEEGRELARRVNEYGRDLTEEYPGQFVYLATLTLPDLEGAVAEAIHALDNLKAAGVSVQASVFGELFGTSRYAPLYKELNDRHATVFIHPGASPCQDTSRNPELATEWSQGIPPYMVDFLLDTSRAAINLVYRKVTTDYPDITFILAHAGGFLPFAATRAANIMAFESGDVSDESTDYFYEELQKFHVDLAVSASATAIPSTAAFFGTNSITFGSDYPFAPVGFIMKNTKFYENFEFNTGAGVGQEPRSSSTHDRIDYKNAYALFGRFLSSEVCDTERQTK